jgi:hypothetical protein
VHRPTADRDDPTEAAFGQLGWAEDPHTQPGSLAHFHGAGSQPRRRRNDAGGIDEVSGQVYGPGDGVGMAEGGTERLVGRSTGKDRHLFQACGRPLLCSSTAASGFVGVRSCPGARGGGVGACFADLVGIAGCGFAGFGGGARVRVHVHGWGWGWGGFSPSRGRGGGTCSENVRQPVGRQREPFGKCPQTGRVVRTYDRDPRGRAGTASQHGTSRPPIGRPAAPETDHHHAVGGRCPGQRDNHDASGLRLPRLGHEQGGEVDADICARSECLARWCR